jgi:gluconate kinase
MTANYHKPPVPVFIFMGTSGCGKSSVAAACQKILGCEVLEGDELHPKSNIDKMSKGKVRRWITVGKGVDRSSVEEGDYSINICATGD